MEMSHRLELDLLLQKSKPGAVFRIPHTSYGITPPLGVGSSISWLATGSSFPLNEQPGAACLVVPHARCGTTPPLGVGSSVADRPVSWVLGSVFCPVCICLEALVRPLRHHSSWWPGRPLVQRWGLTVPESHKVFPSWDGSLLKFRQLVAFFCLAFPLLPLAPDLSTRLDTCGIFSWMSGTL